MRRKVKDSFDLEQKCLAEVQRRVFQWFPHLSWRFTKWHVKRELTNWIAMSYFNYDTKVSASLKIKLNHSNRENVDQIMYQIQDRVLWVYYNFERDKNPLPVTVIWQLLWVNVKSISAEISDIEDRIVDEMVKTIWSIVDQDERAQLLRHNKSGWFMKILSAFYRWDIQ